MSATAAHEVIRHIRPEFARGLAERSPIAPAVVARRLKIIAVIFSFALSGLIAILALVKFDFFVSDSAKLLSAFAGIGAFILTLASAFTAVLLLWGGYVTQYVAALDSKAQLMEAYDIDTNDVADPSVPAVTPVEASGALVKLVTEDAVAIVTALEGTVSNDHLAEVRILKREVASFTQRVDALEHSLTKQQHVKLFESFRARFVEAHKVRALVRWRFAEGRGSTPQHDTSVIPG